MIRFPVPSGTTPRALVTEILPREHATLVPKGAGRARVFVALGDERFSLSADGARLSVEEAGGRGGEGHDLAVRTDSATVGRFLEDWSGPRKYAPTFEAREGVQILTDARVIRRLAMATGSLELAIDDFEGGRAALTVAAGARVVGQDGRAPDAVVSMSTATFERLLGGTLPPDEALTARHVAVRGKMLVAMQFALALAPFFPHQAAPLRSGSR